MSKLRKVVALVSVVAMLFAITTTIYAADSAEAVIQQATVLEESAITVPEGSTVVVSAVKVVEPTEESVKALVDIVKELAFQPETTVLMEVEATGSGDVTFNVGIENAGKAVACRHYNEDTGEWEDLGVGNVDASGNVTFTFTSFSPVALFISSSAEIPVEETSPNTGDNDIIFLIELLALVAVTVAVVARKKMNEI